MKLTGALLALFALANAVLAEPPSGDELPPGALARLGSLRFRFAGGVRYAAFNKDGTAITTFAASGNDIAFRTMDATTGKVTKEWRPTGGYMTHFRFSPDGKQLANVDGSG